MRNNKNKVQRIWKKNIRANTSFKSILLERFLHIIHYAFIYENNILKVVSAIFLLVCFLSLKESTWETMKNVFYSTSKALFILNLVPRAQSVSSSWWAVNKYTNREQSFYKIEFYWVYINSYFIDYTSGN